MLILLVNSVVTLCKECDCEVNKRKYDIISCTGTTPLVQIVELVLSFSNFNNIAAKLKAMIFLRKAESLLV